MKFRLGLLTPLFILFFLGCIDQVQLVVLRGSQPLIVQGFLNEDSASVVLMESFPADGKYHYRIAVPDAKVKIIENGTTEYPLREIKRGTYVSNLKAKVGSSYQLMINIDGEQLESTVETVKDPGQVTDLEFDFSTIEVLVNGLRVTKTIVNFYVSSNFNPEDRDRVRWQWRGTYKIEAFPNLMVNPPRCSGVVDFNCTCCTCWITEVESYPILIDSRLANNDKIKRYFLGSTEVNGLTFYEKYYLEASQTVLSDEVFDFYAGVATQYKSGSSIFQPPFSELKGNITSKNSNYPVLGIFSTTMSSKKGIFITRSDLPIGVAAQNPINDCRRVAPNSTNVRPSFWQ